MKQERFSVLFVCLGNICRSPLGEGIFRHLVEQGGYESKFEIDSCGTGAWHVGEPPHYDSIRVAAENGIDISQQKARRLKKGDIERFDLLVAMDSSNREDIIELADGTPLCVRCMREYDPYQDQIDVPDPYYNAPDGFQNVFDIIERSCESLLDALLKDIGIGKNDSR